MHDLDLNKYSENMISLNLNEKHKHYNKIINNKSNNTSEEENGKTSSKFIKQNKMALKMIIH